MKNILVTNLAVNQFVIKTDQETIFKSYETVIAIIPEQGQKLLDPAWNFSSTTSKYVKEFLGLNKAGIESGIKSGLFKVQDLNKGKKIHKYSTGCGPIKN